MRRLHTRRHRAAAATAAAILVLTACGDDDDPATDVVDTAAPDTTTPDTTTPDTTTPDTTTPDTTTPDTTAPTTVTAPSTTERGLSVEEWAAEVVAVYADLESTRADISGRFVELGFGDDAAPGGEVDGYGLVTSEMAAALNTAVADLPDEPDDPALAGPYVALRAAMTAEEDGSVELSELIEQNRPAYVDEVVANVDPGPDGSPPGTFDHDIRRTHSELWDGTIAACFELQSALVDADLPLLDCVNE